MLFVSVTCMKDGGWIIAMYEILWLEHSNYMKDYGQIIAEKTVVVL